MSQTDQQEAQQPDEDAEARRYERIVDSHCIQLMEHFDYVRVFVGKHDPHADISGGVSRGRGNYYAQRGHVEDWLVAQRAQTRREAAGE
jgi:hypothetical protein